ncbi:MAG TPA: AAA family ATPase [Drouetiella sp.]
MALIDFKVSGYRSIKNVWLRLRPVNVIVGPNGCGKSNLYKSMYLLHCAAKGTLAAVLAEEGGIDSVIWAGPVSKNEAKLVPRMRLSIRSDKFEYNMMCARTSPKSAPYTFGSDPEIKEEDFYLIKGTQRYTLVKRRKSFIEARNAEGKMVEYTERVLPSESVLSSLRDFNNFPELFAIREEILNWRFYHNFRTDIDSPMRKKQISAMTPVLSDDGRDLAAAFETIRELGDGDLLMETLEEAFPGSHFQVKTEGTSRRFLTMQTKGIGRLLEAREFSDGTLQYVCLVCALLCLRPPTLLAINEPEGSLHSQLLEPLAKLIVNASENTQIWLTTHSRQLADAILELTGHEPIELGMVKGETTLLNVGLGGYRESDDLEVSEKPEPD